MPNRRLLAYAPRIRISGRPTAPACDMITASTIDGKSCPQALVDAAQAQKVDIVGETVTPFGDGFCAGTQ